MKKLTALILAAVLCLSLCLFAVSATNGDVLYGEVNGDSVVNSLDAAQILKLDAQLISLSEKALAAADVSGDGIVNSLDAAQVLKYDAELISGFPAEGVFDEPIDEETSEETGEDISFGDVEVGDYVTFGNYEQDNDLSNGKEAIEWLVLDVEDGKALVISKYALEYKDYDDLGGFSRWETSSLRAWLNDGFLNEAFSSAEKEKIPTVTVVTEGNCVIIEMEDDITQDKVFVLNRDEAFTYFDSAWERACAPTEYAKAQGILNDTRDQFEDGNCKWLLRSPSLAVPSNIYGVDCNGYFVDYFITFEYCAIRPAMWIELD